MFYIHLEMGEGINYLQLDLIDNCSSIAIDKVNQVFCCNCKGRGFPSCYLFSSLIHCLKVMRVINNNLRSSGI